MSLQVLLEWLLASILVLEFPANTFFVVVMMPLMKFDFGLARCVTKQTWFGIVSDTKQFPPCFHCVAKCTSGVEDGGKFRARKGVATKAEQQK